MNYLIIGYGNTLRSDDGVGQFVAEQVARWNLASVRSIAVHQLTPELAIDIAQSQTVIFVDAMAMPPVETQANCDRCASESQAESQAESQVQCLDLSDPEQLRDQPSDQPSDRFSGHTVDPRSLLYLTRSLYQATPQAYWVLIPAQDFSLGETFSPLVEAGCAIAIDKIKEIVRYRDRH